ncbi:MAG: hypothetical protein WCP21_13340 [Armatimonadota bacterium]
MYQYLRSLLASHISSDGRDPLSEPELIVLLASGLLTMDDVERVPAPEGTDSGTFFAYTGDRWTTALDECCPLLIPAIYHGPKSAPSVLKRHLGGGPDLEWHDLVYLDLSDAAPTSDFRRLANGRWRHWALPDYIMHVARSQREIV